MQWESSIQYGFRTTSGDSEDTVNFLVVGTEGVVYVRSWSVGADAVVEILVADTLLVSEDVHALSRKSDLFLRKIRGIRPDAALSFVHGDPVQAVVDNVGRRRGLEFGENFHKLCRVCNVEEKLLLPVLEIRD